MRIREHPRSALVGADFAEQLLTPLGKGCRLAPELTRDYHATTPSDCHNVNLAYPRNLAPALCGMG